MSALSLIETLVAIPLPLSEQVQLLRALNDEKVTPEFLSAVVDALQSKIKTAHEVMEALDIFDFSMAASFILAGSGVPIIKHGEISEGRRAGNLDLLHALHVAVPKNAKAVYRDFQEEGLAFINTFHFYPQLAHIREACAVMSASGEGTLFDFLQPFLNPFRPRYIAFRVLDPTLLPIFAETVLLLGRQGLVFSSDKQILQIRRGLVQEYSFSLSALNAQTLGLLPSFADEVSAETVEALLAGQELGPVRDAAVLEAVIGQLAYQPTMSSEEALDKILKSLSGGAALRKLERIQAH